MAQAEDDPRTGLHRRRWSRVLAVFVGLALLVLCGTWLLRERIAGEMIARQLDAAGLPATYRIEAIGARRQVLLDVVVGDPKRPDAVIERIEADLAGSEVTLIKPRVYGRWRDGRISFGSLDKVIYGGGGKQPFRLPALNLTIIDGRGLIEGGASAAGVKLEGRGNLRSGFAGSLALVAPELQAAGCRAERATLYGKVAVENEKPRFSGPLRLKSVACQEGTLASADMQVDASLDPRLDGGEGQFELRARELAAGDVRVSATAGRSKFTWRNHALTARYDLTLRGLESPQAESAAVMLAGVVRGTGERIEADGEVAAEDVQLGQALVATLARAQRAGEGTLAAPLIGQFRNALLREARGSRLAASYIVRRSRAETNIVVPHASLYGGGGATLLSASRLQLTYGASARPRLAGNFATGGAGLPQIAGRIERPDGGMLVTRLTMAEYRAGTGGAEARFGVPRLTIVQRPDGALGFSGHVRLSGALPGGRADNLVLPIDGNWGSMGLAVWRRCTVARFDRLALASLTIERRGIELCPAPGGAIATFGQRGLRVAAGVSSLDVSGRLGGTPIRMRSGAVGFAFPGVLRARALDITLGPAATASRFRIADLGARIAGDIAGRFAGSEVRLAAVPLDILDASGEWRFAGGKLALSGASFRLEDRQADDRFQPLVADDGALTLANNVVSASATMREPASRREVVKTVIRHDLATARGRADLIVAALAFDRQVQPDTLSRLAIGVIANAEGGVRGSGRIDWNANGVTSAGRFSTDGLNFAAAFGPVRGASGNIVFTDLLGMVTAPDQTLRIASINPGIEVNDGLLTFQLEPGQVLRVKGGEWPFVGGSLTLLPVTMRLGVAEVRRYTLLISGLDAARFLERMELANLAATGTFDGALPLVFDENGGRIDGGQLRARAPGGSVSYVGELTYKDLSAIGNFAFDALRSLEYREMTISMNGRLEGEIITRVQFAGIRQGAGAKRNFLTERIAKLPILFNVNVRAPFFQLATSFKSLYDPAYVRDPRSLGLIDASGKPVARPDPTVTGIQPSESGKSP